MDAILHGSHDDVAAALARDSGGSTPSSTGAPVSAPVHKGA